MYKVINMNHLSKFNSVNFPCLKPSAIPWENRFLKDEVVDISLSILIASSAVLIIVILTLGCNRVMLKNSPID